MAGKFSSERQRLIDGEVEDVGDRLAAVLDLQRLAVVAAALALLARHVDVGQEVHLDGDDAVALAGLAPPAFHVEREAARPEPAGPGVRHHREQVADEREQPGVGRRVRARRAADGRLIDLDHLVDELDAVDAIVRARARRRPCRAFCASDRYRMSLTSVDLPEPLTPVTVVNRPSGMLTSMFFRLFSRAPRTTISPFMAGRRPFGTGIDRAPVRGSAGQ